jgi:hypothetical protein
MVVFIYYKVFAVNSIREVMHVILGRLHLHALLVWHGEHGVDGQGPVYLLLSRASSCTCVGVFIIVACACGVIVQACLQVWCV